MSDSTSPSVHPRCAACKGACCEVIIIKLDNPRHRELITAGRSIIVDDHEAVVPCRCRLLTEGGLCSAYATRPEACARAPVGDRVCWMCVRAVRPELAKEWGWA